VTNHADDAGQPSRVLIVDDETFMARAVGCILTDARGAVVEVAASGEQALPLAATFQPHLVLVDVMMPGMSSFDLCVALRQTPGLEAVRLYVLTGLLPGDDVMAPLLTMVDGVINKPPDPGEVLAAFDAVVARQAAGPVSIPEQKA
jgi:DNA-binding response OmpR family regulator